MTAHYSEAKGFGPIYFVTLLGTSGSKGSPKEGGWILRRRDAGFRGFGVSGFRTSGSNPFGIAART